MRKVLIVLGSLLLIAYCLLIFLTTTYQACKTKELDNPYINAKYQDWKQIQLDDLILVRIPEEWTFTQDQDQMILSSGDNIVAIGTRIEKSSENGWRKWYGLIEKQYNKTVEDTHSQDWNDYDDRFSDGIKPKYRDLDFAHYLTVYFSDESKKETVHFGVGYKNYQSDGYNICFVFFPENMNSPTTGGDLANEVCSLMKYAEAIVWSKEFVGEKLGFLYRWSNNVPKA